jgi:hypothetical protein
VPPSGAVSVLNATSEQVDEPALSVTVVLAAA